MSDIEGTIEREKDFYIIDFCFVLIFLEQGKKLFIVFCTLLLLLLSPTKKKQSTRKIEKEEKGEKFCIFCKKLSSHENRYLSLFLSCITKMFYNSNNKDTQIFAVSIFFCKYMSWRVCLAIFNTEINQFCSNLISRPRFFF